MWIKNTGPPSTHGVDYPDTTSHGRTIPIKAGCYIVLVLQL